MSERRVAFGPFVLDREVGTLSREGVPVPVGYRGMLLLSALLSRPGEVLTKSDLIDAAWQGSIVEETNLSVQIASLRKHLGQAPRGGDWIATVPRVGYRFVGPIATGAEEGRQNPVSSSRQPEPQNRPSIAVLPFVNLSDDREQEYFADGMVEEIITALSRMRGLFVVARNSSFIYKGRAVDAKQVGQELGVRYILEGSVRKHRNRVRIAGQLIDTSTGAHLWADRFEGELEDVFDLQDQVTATVAAAIAPKLEAAEIERAKRKPTESLDGYDYFLRGMGAFHRWTIDANHEALLLFLKAIELDSEFAAAYAMAARCYAQRKSMGGLKEPAIESADCFRLATRALELGRDDAVALTSAGSALMFVAGNLDLGATAIDNALRLNPNLAWAWLSSALVRALLGEPEVAIEHAARAMQLSPYDTQFFVMQTITALAHFLAGRYADALAWSERACSAHLDYVPSTSVLAASAALAGNQIVAGHTLERLLRLVPTLRLSNLKELLFPIRRHEDFRRWSEALEKAGLPV
jgi:TolB-like protein